MKNRRKSIFPVNKSWESVFLFLLFLNFIFSFTFYAKITIFGGQEFIFAFNILLFVSLLKRRQYLSNYTEEEREKKAAMEYLTKPHVVVCVDFFLFFKLPSLNGV